MTTMQGQAKPLPYKRSNARQLMFQAIYAGLLSKSDQLIPPLEAETMKYDKTYFRKLMGLYQEHQEAISKSVLDFLRVEKASAASLVERSIVLMGAIELLYLPGTPTHVVINESVDLAHKFGAEGGYKFVNAVLDALAKKHR